MKRTDLVVGAELYYANTHTWAMGSSGTGARAVVVATEPYADTTPTWTRNEGRQLEQVAKGSGVLVDLYYPHSPDNAHRNVVPLAYLRGPYAETKAVVDAAGVERMRLRDAEHSASVTRRERIEKLVVRAAAMGVRVSIETVWPNRTVLAIDPDVFEGLLGELTKAGG